MKLFLCTLFRPPREDELMKIQFDVVVYIVEIIAGVVVIPIEKWFTMRNNI